MIWETPLAAGLVYLSVDATRAYDIYITGRRANRISFLAKDSMSKTEAKKHAACAYDVYFAALGMPTIGPISKAVKKRVKSHYDTMIVERLSTQ